MASDRNSRQSVRTTRWTAPGRAYWRLLPSDTTLTVQLLNTVLRRERADPPTAGDRHHGGVDVDGGLVGHHGGRQVHPPDDAAGAVERADPPRRPTRRPRRWRRRRSGGRRTAPRQRRARPETEAGTQRRKHRPRRRANCTAGRSSGARWPHTCSPVSGSLPIAGPPCLSSITKSSMETRSLVRRGRLRPHHAAVLQVEGVEARAAPSSRSAARCRAASSRRPLPGR